MEELSSHLKGLSQESDFQLVELSRSDLAGDDWLVGFRDLLPLGKATFEVQLALPWVLNRMSLDVVHFCSHGDSPAFSNKSSIVTVLDLIPLKFPELYKAPNKSWRFNFARWLELQAIRRARGVIAISEATKRDLIEILGISEQKIRVTHLAVDSDRLGLEKELR